MLEAYIIWSSIILLITASSIFGYGVNRKDVGTSVIGLFAFLVTLVLLIQAIPEYHEPKAIEVYQGKTTLEYTVKDGVKVDSVVVYKDGSKRD